VTFYISIIEARFLIILVRVFNGVRNNTVDLLSYNNEGVISIPDESVTNTIRLLFYTHCDLFNKKKIL